MPSLSGQGTTTVDSKDASEDEENPEKPTTSNSKDASGEDEEMPSDATTFDPDDLSDDEYPVVSGPYVTNFEPMDYW